MISQVLTFLPWDSDHFDRRIARASAPQLDATLCRRLLQACEDQSIDCLYFLADAADQDTVSLLQQNGFDFVDIRLTLVGNVNSMPKYTPVDDIQFRLGDAGDISALLPIAASSYRQSRFYVDRRFGSEKASEMYEIWLRKCLTPDRAQAVVVAELQGSPIGYVTCRVDSATGEGGIGLVGVAESGRGLGVATGMTHYAIRWMREQDASRISVVTQGRNVPAQRLFQRCGFVTGAVELWFHKWFA